MADLIDRKILADEIRSLRMTIIGLRNGKDVLAKCAKEYRDAVLQIIDEQPTVDPSITTMADIMSKTTFQLFMQQFNHHEPGSLMPVPPSGIQLRVIIWDPATNDYCLGATWDERHMIVDDGSVYTIEDDFYWRDLPLEGVKKDG